MASLHNRNGTWYLSFRFGGTQFLPSLKTEDESEAKGTKALVEETIRLLNTGRLSLPLDATREKTLTYILSGGKLTEKPIVADTIDLATVITEYFTHYAVGKEPTTVKGEKIHTGHFRRILGEGTAFAAINGDQMQKYVATRSKEKGTHNRKVSPETIKKEFRTFNQVWKMAVMKGYVRGGVPTKGVRFNLIDEKTVVQDLGRNRNDHQSWRAYRGTRERILELPVPR